MINFLTVFACVVAIIMIIKYARLAYKYDLLFYELEKYKKQFDEDQNIN